jgi:hypothetical protein
MINQETRVAVIPWESTVSLSRDGREEKAKRNGSHSKL